MILMLAAGIYPLNASRFMERTLDASAGEVMAAIRETEMAASAGKDTGTFTAGISFVIENKNGRVHYFARRGTTRVKPEGFLPEEVVLPGGDKSLFFTKSGFAGYGRDYSILLMTKDGKYKRRIVVAMYTGRVHMENG